MGLNTKSTKINGKTKRIVPLDNKLLEVVKRYSNDPEKVTGVTGVTEHVSTPVYCNLGTHLDKKQEIEEDVTTVTPVTPVTTETHKIPWDDRVISHRKCDFEECFEVETNEYEDGKHYCKLHYDVMSTPKPEVFK